MPSFTAPSTTETAWTVDGVLAVLDHVRLACGFGAARCPAHDDRWGTLALCEVEPGDIAFHCSGGCHEDDIREAVDRRLSMSARKYVLASS